MREQIKNIALTTLILLFISIAGIAQSKSHDHVKFTQNKGQWHTNIKYKAKMNFGNFYLEENGFTYHFYNKSDFSREAHVGKGYEFPDEMQHHVIKSKFIGANSNIEINNKNALQGYENYFIGNDKSKWATEVKSYTEIEYKNLYNYIDLKVYQYAQYIKYDFIVDVGGNPDDILIEYKGTKDIKIKNGSIYLKTRFGSIIEKEPIAFQNIDGKEVEVKVKYKLKNGKVKFIFPNGYNEDYSLTIDPILIFSTYTGSSSDNWGYTATYDNDGNAYAAGIVFGAGYPVTAGAYSSSSAGGQVDIGVTKFNSTGTNLIYSTYLGGSNVESPHSLVVDDNDNLFIMGTTSSTNFPTIASSFDPSFNGGTGFAPNYFTYTNGSDLFVTKLNVNGTAIDGSTYLGGSGNDGLNTGIEYFYGDEFRGEVIIDGSGNCLVISSTESTDAQMAGSSPQPVNNGGTDAIVFKLNSNLSSLLWSTYWGGSLNEGGLGVQLDSNGDIFITGGTQSNNLFSSPNAFKGSSSGNLEGFVAKFSSNGNSILGTTYLGTTSNDISFLIQVDENDDIYVLGVSEGNYPKTPGLYNNGNSNQFIHKLNNSLTASVWSTTIGTGNGTVDFSPTAFLVNDCGLIYISGWGGTLGGQNILSSTTSGLPITPNAFQTTTTGEDFYFMVLDQEASGLLYGTFFGGVSGEHVDGGTSRFDKKGIVYHAVCAGCGGNSNFPSTAGAWSQTNNSTNCNLSVFKFGLNNINSLVSVPAPYVCIPNSYTFNNNSVGGNTFTWNFGDGNTSTQFSPSHLYQDTGTYEVWLVVSDSTGCLESDSTNLFVDVFAVDDAGILPIDTICPYDSVQLEAYGGVIFNWFPATDLSNPNIHNPYASPLNTTTYFVEVADSCSTDTTQITVYVYGITNATSPDTSICIGQSIGISASGGISYQWMNDPSISNTNISNPTVTPTVPTMYYVEITTPDGCIIPDSVFVDVYYTPPVPITSVDTTICYGDTIQIFGAGAPYINWLTNYNIENANIDTTLVWPLMQTDYIGSFTNACGTVYDTISIEVDDINPSINADTTICPRDSAKLYATGGNFYDWTPSSTLTHPDSSTTFATPMVDTEYTVTVTNANGCSRLLKTTVFMYPMPFVSAGADKVITYGENIGLNGSTGAHIYYWTPNDSLSCDTCLNPIANPATMTDYIFNVVDNNGCKNSDTMTVFLDAALYVPNAFTPNGDSYNDIFLAKGVEINTFEILIFDRWGEIIYTSDDLNAGWDGFYKGTIAKSDVYVWKITFTDYINPNIEQKMIGHVTLVR